MRQLPTGTVTLLFTDIEGSTRLLHELGNGYAAVLAEHRRILRDAFGRHGGIEVDTQGDAFFYAFARADEAVAAAADAQDALAAGPVRVRIGIHTGDPLATDEGYVGIDVHRAARIMSAGHGGQVVVSDETHALIDNGLALSDLGLHRLKDLTQPQRLWQLGTADFPPLKTLYQTNLPVQPTPLIGRTRELSDVVALLRGARLVTLTGPGGVGKTRLALQSTAELAEDFRDGVWWVPLVALRDAELVEPAIAQVVGARDGLDEHLRDRTVLLLLDNFEHLLNAAPVISRLLEDAGNVRVVATSRERLGLAAEHEYSVPSMVPTEAVALFTARARQIRPTFEPDDAVDEICRRLDGLPLAVELAAARIKVLRPEQIFARLAHALDLLTTGARDAIPRHRTLRSTIEWSCELLTDDEKELFGRLAVFVGSFDLDAAEVVCGADLDALQSLVDKSLVRDTGVARFFLLETIREFAIELLDRSDEIEAVGSRHANYYVGVAEQGEPGLQSAEDREWLARFDAERDNFRTAFAFARDHDLPELALRLIAALRLYWGARVSTSELRQWLDEALEHAGDALPEQRADALQVAALSAYWAGDYGQTERYAQQMLKITRQLGDREREVSALTKMGAAASGMGDVARSRALMEEALGVARELGKPARLALSLSNLASAVLEEGEFAYAAELCEESLVVGDQAVDSSGRASALLNLSAARTYLGQTESATAAAREALQLAASRSDQRLVAEALLLIGRAVAASDAPRSCRLMGAAARLREEAGASLAASELRSHEELVEWLRSALGDASFDEAFENGRQLAFEQAVELGSSARPA